MSEKKLDATKTPRKYERPPGSESKNKGKDLSGKVKKQHRGAKSHLQKVGSESHMALEAPRGVAPHSRLTLEETRAWQKLKLEQKDSAEQIEIDSPPPDSDRTEKDGRKQGRHRVSLRMSKEIAPSPETSPVKSSGESAPQLQKQSPPKGSLRVMSRGGALGNRKSSSVTPRKMPRKGQMTEAYEKNLKTLRDKKLDRLTEKKMHAAIDSADVIELSATLTAHRTDYAKVTNEIQIVKRKLEVLERQQLILAGTIKRIDERIAKNPQIDFPVDEEWDALDGSPNSMDSPSRSRGEHRRVQTDKI